MKKLMITIGVALISGILILTAPVMAQTVDNPSTQERVLEDDEDDDSGKWGWLGLLGLLELYGLKREDHDTRHTKTTLNR